MVISILARAVLTWGAGNAPWGSEIESARSRLGV